ncbi:MAG: hypothetical protein P8K68_05770 [Algibacter sp.]|uniref:hypothetical protein n=1 Tax=Algibacter sp. TaxID=1872428 RepID=UPI00260F706D|nr:hypothetical protein [Algibacter sp.]MDG1731286.1 hypothetical protein [Algibacter sp.]MDG2178284.1 hypothetical protein [Algibacter sp.]
MNTLSLSIAPIEIVIFGLLLVILYVTALYFLSKNVRGWRFFIWFLIVMFIPIAGAVSYLIYHTVDSRNHGTTVY